MLSLLAIPNASAVIYGSVTINVSKDTHVSDCQWCTCFNSNYGSSTTLLLRHWSNTAVWNTCRTAWASGGTKYSDYDWWLTFLVFNLSSIPLERTRILNSTMELYAYDSWYREPWGISQSIILYETNVSWTESTLTANKAGILWGNKTYIYCREWRGDGSCPINDDNRTTSGWTYSNAYVPWNVTNVTKKHYNTDKNLNLFLYPHGSAFQWKADFSSKEGSYPPRLTVWYEQPECGDNICDPDFETHEECCTDCGCPSGLECFNNACKVGGMARFWLVQIFGVGTIFVFIVFVYNYMLKTEMERERDGFKIGLQLVGVFIVFLVALFLIAELFKSVFG